MINPGQPALVLAPMEGVTDAPMRALQSELGGFTFCVSEFLRVSQDVPPARVFLEHIPELRNGCRTAAGLPVGIQLLGGDPEKLARSALVAVGLGATVIDLNFGCPAPTVNRHDGGATLLKHPDRIRSIVSAVRQAVPSHVPVSAKLRLGWDTIDAVHLNADRAAEGGADWITIHARTRMQAYQPPVYWGPIGEVRKRLSIPVVANGDIWTIDDFKRCRDMTGSEHFMLGRSALADPALPLRVAKELGLRADAPDAPFGVEAAQWFPLIERFVAACRAGAMPEQRILPRVKQWLRMAHVRTPLAFWDGLKLHEKLEPALDYLRRPTRYATQEYALSPLSASSYSPEPSPFSSVSSQ